MSPALTPLLAAGQAGPGAPAGTLLTAAMLEPMLTEAIGYWAGAGLDPALLPDASQIDLGIANLGGVELSSSTSGLNQMVIDRDAAGYGWSTGLTTGPTAGRVDLLSSMVHELGHLWGLEHADQAEYDVMAGQLAPATRPASLAAWAQADSGLATATVDYGDGSGPETLALAADKTFALGHVYVDNGNYTVSITVDDTDGGLGSTTLPVTVNNVAPQAILNGPSNLVQGEPARYTFRATDVAADQASFDFVVDWGDGSFGYTHSGGFNGTDSFTYLARNAGGDSTPATVTVTVNNVAPTANDDAANVGEDGPSLTIDLLANDTDPGGAADPLTVTSIDTGGTLGAVTLTAGAVTYDPNGQFEQLANGQTAIDTFAYAISDGDGGTSSGLVTITIAGVNDSPVASLGGSSGTEPDDQDQAFNWSVSDVDGNLDTVVVDVRRDGVPVGALSGPASPIGRADFNGLGVGLFEITLTATDTDGAAVALSRAASVVDDDSDGPTITLGGSSGTQLEIDTNQFSWNVTDVSGLSALSVVVTRDTDAGPVMLYSTTDLSDAAGSFNFDDQGVGVFEIVVVATDADGDWAGDGAVSSAGRTTVVGEIFVSTTTRAKLQIADGEWVTLQRSDMTSVASGNVLFDSSQLSHPWFSWWRPNLDAFHMLEDGSMILSTSGSGNLGDTDFRNGGLVRFYGDEWLARNADNPGNLHQTAAMVATEVQIFGDNNFGTNIDAISIAADGDLVISIARSRALADGQTYQNGDLIKISLRADGSLAGSSLYFDQNVLNATGRSFFGSWWSDQAINVNGAHVLDDGRIVLTTSRTTEVGAGGPQFEDGDLFVYDPISGTAELLFDEGNFRRNEDIDAVFLGVGNGMINFLEPLL